MVLYATVVIRGLYLWYNSSNIKYISCNKPFKAFLEHQMFKDKPTPLLAIKMWNFYTTLMQQLHCVKRVRIRSYSGLQFSLIFPHSDWIRRNTEYLSVFSPNAGKCGKNADQNNSEYGHPLRSASYIFYT